MSKPGATSQGKQRAIMLSGTPNFRDLGGLPTIDGRSVASGRLFRSEGPRHLTADDCAALQACGFRLVCDLRSQDERLAAPNSWCEPELLYHAEIGADLRAAGNNAWSALKDSPSAEGARRAMLLNYQALPRAMAPHLRALLVRVLERGDLPLLVHCTAGKDRTGFAIAILLHALDVEPEAIEADYLASLHYVDDRFAASIVEAFRESFGFAPSAETVNGMIAVERAYLQTAMDAAVALAGSLDRYVESQLGLDAARREQLRELMLG